VEHTTVLYLQVLKCGVATGVLGSCQGCMIWRLPQFATCGNLLHQNRDTYTFRSFSQKVIYKT
jgi:hypothetical protein